MTEKPIIFNSIMADCSCGLPILAIEAILNGRKTQTRRVIKPQPLFTEYETPILKQGKWYSHIGGSIIDAPYKDFRCPYGVIGDRLWVRETYCAFNDGDFYYKADNPDIITHLGTGEPIKWQPSIFMPRWASRINLEIVNVRVEKLQDITEEDAKKEGAMEGKDTGYYNEGFYRIWDKINGKDSWKKNPFVWVISFIKL